eukprot:COSAG02_NODE_573_length_20153_cov_11.609305_2_plen_795_part_00
MSQRATALAVGGLAWCRASTLRQMGAVVGPDALEWLQVRLLGKVGGEGADAQHWKATYSGTGTQEFVLKKQHLRKNSPLAGGATGAAAAAAGAAAAMAADAAAQAQGSPSAQNRADLPTELLSPSAEFSALDLELPATVVAKLKRLEEATVDTAAGELIEPYKVEVKGRAGSPCPDGALWTIHPPGTYVELPPLCAEPCVFDMKKALTDRIPGDMPDCITKFSREQARALWCIFFPGTDDHVHAFNAYVTEYKQLPAKYTITKDDWIEYHLLLALAVLYPGSSVDELFRREDPDGFVQPANFRRFMDISRFQHIRTYSPWGFAKRSEWGKHPLRHSYDMISDFLSAFSSSRADLFGDVAEAFGYCMDEIIAAWKSKASLTGGLPNITSEPRKPKDMGAMLKALADVRSGVMRHLEMCEAPEAMEQKKFFDLTVKWAGKDGAKATANVLRMIETLPPGSHAAGDSWFGSVLTAILARKLGYDFTGIVKGKTWLFPIAEFRSIAQDLKRGEWRTATTTIDGVDLLAVVYRFSYAGKDRGKDRGCNFLISTTGSTTPGPDYAAHWSDENGHVHFTSLPRPLIVGDYFSKATIVDDHDNARQHKLAIEEAWATSDCWFRLETTFTGICFTDMWKGCDAADLLPPPINSARRIPIKRFLNLYGKVFFRKPEQKMCKLKSWDPIYKKGQPHKGNPAKRYKTDQYPKYSCYVCKRNQHTSSERSKVYTAFQYCEICNPEGDKCFAICSPGTGRQCFDFTAKRWSTSRYAHQIGSLRLVRRVTDELGWSVPLVAPEAKKTLF